MSTEKRRRIATQEQEDDPKGECVVSSKVLSVLAISGQVPRQALLSLCKSSRKMLAMAESVQVWHLALQTHYNNDAFIASRKMAWCELDGRRGFSAYRKLPFRASRSILVNNLAQITWSPDGEQFASVEQRHTIRIWDAGSGQEVAALGHDNNIIQMVEWSPDSVRLVSVSFTSTQNHILWAIRLWNGHTGEQLWTLDNHQFETDGVHRHPPHDIQWSPKGNVLIVYDLAHRGTLLIDAVTGEFADDGIGERRDWSPDGHQFATQGTGSLGSERSQNQAAVVVWDGTSGQKLPEFKWTIENPHILRVAWSPNGRNIATSSKGGGIHIWDAQSGKELLAIERPVDCEDYLQWSPDGRHLAVVCDAENSVLRVWAVENGKLLHAFCDPDVLHVAWSPDGQFLASATEYGPIRVRDISTGDQLCVLQPPNHEQMIALSEHGPFLRGQKLLECEDWYCTAGDDDGVYCYVTNIGWFPRNDGRHRLFATFTSTNQLLTKAGSCVWDVT